MTIQRSERKQWAKQHMKGVEGCIFPSFAPDMGSLDEDGIRWDVQQSIRHGFFSVMCSAETGLTFEEAKQFVKIVAQEAQGKIGVTATLLFDTWEQNRAMLAHAEQVGCDAVLFGYPPNYYPTSEDEIFQVSKEMFDSTDLGIVLYPSPHYNFQRLHFSGFPPSLLSRLADLPNAVAIKVGEPGLAAECVRRFGDHVLVNCPVERWLPLCHQSFGQQWLGAGCYEVYQSPEKPLLVQYFNLLMEGKTDEAMEIYWALTPARVIFEQQFNLTVMSGTYHWPQQKYYQWLVGGNGGYTRQPCMKLHQHEMEASKMAFRMIGIEPREPDEEFYVGRMNWEKARKASRKVSLPAEIGAQDPAGGLSVDVSTLSLPDAFDQDVALQALAGQPVVLYGGGKGAMAEGKKWAAAFAGRAADLGGAKLFQVAFVGGLPAFVPKKMIKDAAKDGPPTLLDWKGAAEKALGLEDANTVHVYVVDARGMLRFKLAEDFSDTAFERVLTQVKALQAG